LRLGIWRPVSSLLLLWLIGSDSFSKFLYVYIKHVTLFKQKSNKKHVEIHTVGSGCVGDDTFCSDWESGDPFRRDLRLCLGLTVLAAGSYTYI
jgi:hypothetical protein